MLPKSQRFLGVDAARVGVKHQDDQSCVTMGFFGQDPLRARDSYKKLHKDCKVSSCWLSTLFIRCLSMSTCCPHRALAQT